MTAEPEYVEETKAWCNERRVEQGLPPLDRLPKGRRGDPGSCPCGKATGLAVGHEEYYSSDGLTWLGNLPWAVHEFVYEFDAGLLPQYEETP